jgi:hypothetical protein
MTNGGANLASVTYEQLCNGANAAVMVSPEFGAGVTTDRPDFGDAEVFQFTTVTQNTDGTFTLTGLARGRRGTETRMGNHKIGDLFILLDSNIRTLKEPATDSEALRFFKPVSVGMSIESATAMPYVSATAPLRPYAPCHIKAETNGIDLWVSWVRRTRFGGELQDDTGDVPLNESLESYRVWIWNADRTAVIRTFSPGVARPSIKYDNAHLLQDFGHIPSEITVEVAQISSAVGVGFTTIKTVKVN